MQRIAIATRCLGRPLMTVLKLASESGADGIQLDLRTEVHAQDLSESGRKQFLRLLEDLHLAPAGAVYTTRGGFADEDGLEARIAGTRQALAFARQLRMDTLCIRPGRLPPVDSKERKLLYEVLSDLARHGDRVGVTLTLTPTLTSPADLAPFLESIRAGRIGLDLDPAGLVAGGHSPTTAVRLLYSFLTHVQGRDGRKDSEGLEQEAPFGQGSVDWNELIALLHEADYRGWMTAVRTQGGNLPGDTLRAVKSLRELRLSAG